MSHQLLKNFLSCVFFNWRHKRLLCYRIKLFPSSSSVDLLRHTRRIILPSCMFA